MTNERGDQNFDDWFAANIADGRNRPPSADEPPAPPQFTPPPATFDPALDGAGVPPQPVGPPEPYPLTEPAMPNEWASPPVYDPQEPPLMQHPPSQQLPPQQPMHQPPPQQFSPQLPPRQPMQQPLMPQQLPQLPPTFDPALSGQDAMPTEYIPSAPRIPSGDPGDANALDALFGDERFRDYESEPDPTLAFAGVSPDEAAVEPPKEISRLHVTMMWVAGSGVALLALTAFFLVGTKLPMLTGTGLTDPSPAATDPADVERPVGPVAPGTYNWNELLGGECLEEFLGAWENEYTVVDCAQPHAAQLVFRGSVPIVAGTGGVYPGVYDLQSRMNLLCTDAAVIDYEAAKEFNDIQFEASFPPTTEDWDAGRRDYFCFVSRASGEPLEGSLAAPPAPDEPAVEEEGGIDEGTEGD